MVPSSQSYRGLAFMGMPGSIKTRTIRSTARCVALSLVAFSLLINMTAGHASELTYLCRLLCWSHWQRSRLLGVHGYSHIQGTRHHILSWGVMWADSAYPSEMWCVAPYKKPIRARLTPDQRTYNYHVSKVRLPLGIHETSPY